MESIPVLLQHGALGAIVVMQAALIYYLLNRVKELTDKIIEISDKQDVIHAALVNGKKQ